MKFLITDLYKSFEKSEITRLFADIPVTTSGIQIGCPDLTDMISMFQQNPDKARESVSQLLTVLYALPINVKRVAFLELSWVDFNIFVKIEPEINRILSNSGDLEFIQRFLTLELIAVNEYGGYTHLFDPHNPSSEIKEKIRQLVYIAEGNLAEVLSEIKLPTVVNRITIEYITGGRGLFANANTSVSSGVTSEIPALK
jgi:hypothetical protein